MLNEIKLNYAIVQLFEPEFVRVEIFGNNIITNVESKAIVDAIGELSNKKEVLVLMVADEITQFDKSASEFSASNEGLKYTIADAIVVKSLAQKLIANFYLKFHKPFKPTKLFNTEAEAIAWLFSLKEN